MADVPVLMVHGFASSFERNWREPGWVDVLHEEGHQVIGVDVLGHGQAPKPTDPEAYRNLHVGVENALPTDGPVDAVGFSMGGQLLLRVASRSPERFRKIAIGGVGDNIFSTAVTEQAAVAIEEGRSVGPDDEGTEGHESLGAFARFAQAPGNDPAALAACMRRPQERLTEDDLASVKVPVLVVLGDKDFAGPADRLMAALPEARLVTLAGADHFGTPKDFRFIDAVVEFLR
jgi:pimeloyl-ACP methyl ester carboxylesterase